MVCFIRLWLQFIGTRCSTWGKGQGNHSPLGLQPFVKSIPLEFRPLPPTFGHCRYKRPVLDLQQTGVQGLLLSTPSPSSPHTWVKLSLLPSATSESHHFIKNHCWGQRYHVDSTFYYLFTAFPQPGASFPLKRETCIRVDQSD